MINVSSGRKVLLAYLLNSKSAISRVLTSKYRCESWVDKCQFEERPKDSQRRNAFHFMDPALLQKGSDVEWTEESWDHRSELVFKNGELCYSCHGMGLLGYCFEQYNSTQKGYHAISFSWSLLCFQAVNSYFFLRSLSLGEDFPKKWNRTEQHAKAGESVVEKINAAMVTWLH